MQTQILNDKRGLHNRVTEIIHLHPFNLAETKLFFKSKNLHFSNQEIAKIYMALGGIPFYLENIRKGESFAVAIERICFAPNGLLKNEYNNLYQALFNHRFIKPNKKYTSGIWQQLAQGQSYKIWLGYAFEALCHRHINEIKETLGIGAVFTTFSSLNAAPISDRGGFQIDLIIDRKDDSINLCEMKFHAAPFLISKSDYQNLIQKRQRFIDYTSTKKQVFITLITNQELVKNNYSLEIVDAEITLEDLFKD